MAKKTVKEDLLRHRSAIGISSLILALCLSCFGLNQQGSKRTRADSQTNTQPAIQVSASRSLVKLPPNTPELVPLNCEPTESKVRLYASNTISSHKATNFTWQVPVGRLTGKNRAVTWDLSGVEAGTYTATVEASDSHKHTASGSVTVTVIICPSFRPDPPPCPTVWVSCPSKAESKDSVTFEATVAGGPDIKPTYKWSLSAGKIISGKATSRIAVDVSRVSHESVTATVSVGGFNPLCSTRASCTVQVAAPN